MGLSSSGGGGKPDAAPTPAAHQSFGDTLMGMIKQRYPIAGAIGSAVGIGGGNSAPSPTSAPTVSAPAAGPIPLPPIDMAQSGGQQAPIDPQMLQAGQIGSQHSPLAQMLKALIAGG